MQKGQIPDFVAASLFALLLIVQLVWQFGQFSSMYDQQRAFQALMVLVALVFFGVKLFSGAWVFRGTVAWWVMFVVALAFGVASSLIAEYPWWALKEVAVLVSSLLLVLSVAAVVGVVGINFVVLTACLVGLFVGANVLLGFVVLSISPGWRVDVMTFSSGFSHPRFLGQIVVALLPLICVVGLCSKKIFSWASGRLIGCVSFFVCFSFFLALIFGGSRGALLSIVMSWPLLVFLSRLGWRILKLQLLALLASILVYCFCLVNIGGGYFSGDLSGGGILRAGFTGRDYLWLSAADALWANPWLGVGPMHLASNVNLTGSHPHNSLLQVLAEWGLLSGLILVGLFLCFFVRSVRAIFIEDLERVDGCVLVGLMVGIYSATILSLFDGVFVVPYAQQWLCFLCGSVLAIRWVGSGGNVLKPSRVVGYIFLYLFAAFVFYFVFAVYFGYSGQFEYSDCYVDLYSDPLRPRFWHQGVISVQVRGCSLVP